MKKPRRSPPANYQIPGWPDHKPAPARGEHPATIEARSLKFTDEAIRRVAMGDQKPKVNPFTLPSFPPGVKPKNASLAMDDAFGGDGGVFSWAQNELDGLSGAGTGIRFLGFATLAALSQRAEYRKICETLATEMTRKWIRIKSKGTEDKTDRIDAINAAMKKFKVQSLFRKITEHDGYFGRAHIFVDLGVDWKNNAAELQTPIGNGDKGPSKIKLAKGKLKGLRAIEPQWCYAQTYNSENPLDPTWYKPDMWGVMGTQVHSSRLLKFVGRDVPDMLKPAYGFGGIPLTQMCMEYVDNWLETRSSVNKLIQSFSNSGIKTNVHESLATNGEDLRKRLATFRDTRDNQGIMALDSLEEFFNVSVPLGTLDLLQAQAQEHMCAVSGIPVVILLGIQPAGMNASSAGELEAFYRWVHAFQVAFFGDNLTAVLNILQMNEFGEVDPDIYFEFEKLEPLTELELAELRKTEAETAQIHIQSGVIDKAEERKILTAEDEGRYAELDGNDVPKTTANDEAEFAVKMTTAVAGAVTADIITVAMGMKALRTLPMFADVISDADIAEAEAAPPPPPEGTLPGLNPDDPDEAGVQPPPPVAQAA